MGEYGTPAEAAKIIGVSRQALMKQLPALVRNGLAERVGSRWRVRLEGLRRNYNNVVAPRIDSPRFSAWW